MKSVFLCACLAAAPTAFGAEAWFDYPSGTYLKSMNPDITRFDLKKDVKIDPNVTGITLFDTSVRDDERDSDSGTRCDLGVAAATDYRRILAGTKFFLKGTHTSGNADAYDERSRARVTLDLVSEGGFAATLTCSSWYYYEASGPDDDDDYGSSSDQTPYSINDVFRSLRRETIITRD